MKRIVILDPTICSNNLGDFIIKEAVLRELHDLSRVLLCYISTQERISQISHGILEGSEFAMIAGTNLLSSKMNKYKQWQIGIYDAFKIKDIILFGVGWWQYQEEPNSYNLICFE